jgi:hypothetical protein
MTLAAARLCCPASPAGGISCAWHRGGKPGPVPIEAESQQPHLTPPDDSPEAQQRGQALAAEIRQQLRDKLDGSLAIFEIK